MLLTGDPHADFDRWDRKREKYLSRLPICECCGEPIQDEELYDFDGDLVCEECVFDYVRENYRKNIENYTED